MKKFLFLLLACSIAAVSCHKEELLIKTDVTSVANTGGIVKIDVTSNTDWTVKADLSGVTFDKPSGSGNATVTATVGENPGTQDRTITVTIAGNSAIQTISINQKANVSPELKTKFISMDYDFEGGTIVWDLKSNLAWTSTVTSDNDKYTATLNTTSGLAGTTRIIATLPENTTDKDVRVTFLFETKNSIGSSSSKETYTIETPGFELGKERYKAVKMADGRWWMAENLRYVPEGYTPSSDLKNVTAGVYFPIKVNDAKTAAEFSSDKDVIKANGYLYQSEVALGLKVGDVKSEDDAKALEGAQGICPEGWHIPTSGEIINLVGKAVSPFETKEDAPYYDANKKNASIEKLNADGFNAAAWGAVSIQDNTKTSATLMGFLKSSPDIISSGYICGSTYVSKTEKEGAITNIQFLGFMPMANNGTFNGAKLSYRIGASVRCIKDIKE